MDINTKILRDLLDRRDEIDAQVTRTFPPPQGERKPQSLRIVRRDWTPEPHLPEEGVGEMALKSAHRTTEQRQDKRRRLEFRHRALHLPKRLTSEEGNEATATERGDGDFAPDERLI